MKKNITKIIKDQKGVALVLTFFIMLIILTVVLSISVILYSETKVLRSIGNSVIGLYAADSGIEKVLYYDNQVKPEHQGGTEQHTAKRGLCAIYSINIGQDWVNSNRCSEDLSPLVPSEHSIFCNNVADLVSYDSNKAPGCNVDDCTNCTIQFDTTLDDNLNGSVINYSTTASVYPDSDPILNPNKSYFEINSKGTYGSESRKIQIIVTETAE